MAETDEASKPNETPGEPEDKKRPSAHEELVATIGDKEARKLHARRVSDKSVWFGLGMLGMIGWSISVPALLGLALGLWLDRRWPVYFSWTLTLLFLGLILGCLNAWFWVNREQRSIDLFSRPQAGEPGKDIDSPNQQAGHKEQNHGGTE